MISTKKRYMATDGWRGYEEPINAVAGANDTGSYSDSPCPTDVRVKELATFKRELSKAGIKYKQVFTQTSNVFCVHVYVLVAPEDREKALEIAELCRPGTRLFYVVREKETAK